MRDFVPVTLLSWIAVVGVSILISIVGLARPVHAPEFRAMRVLLNWNDPVSGESLPLPINREAPSYRQVVQLWYMSELNLFGPDISELPAEIGMMTNLEHLYLNNTQIKDLPPEIGNMTSLSTLSVIDSPLQDIPLEVAQLPNLRRLYLSRTQIGSRSFPQELNRLCMEIFCYR